MSWETKTLGEIANVAWGNTSITKEKYQSAGYAAFSASGCDGFLPDYEFDCSGIVLSAIGARCGKCFLAQGRWTAIKNTITITHDQPDVFDVNYLFFFLNNNACWPKKGGGQPFVSLGDARSIVVPLPALIIQRHIAKVLEQADRLRRQAQQMEAELDRLAQALFLDMFGDYRQQAAENFLPLAEVADVVSGVAKGSKLSGAVRTLPYLRVANVQDGFLDLSEIKEIGATERDIEKYRLKAGDILMTEGGDFDKLGRGAMWSGEIAECIHQNHIFRVRLSDAYEPRFFECYLRTPMVKTYFLGCAKKTTNLASINMSQLKALPTPKEPLDRQKQFVAALQQIEAQRQMARRQQAELEQAFQSLMQRAFKGELTPKLA